jgi:hypothetical protein
LEDCFDDHKGNIRDALLSLYDIFAGVGKSGKAR